MTSTTQIANLIAANTELKNYYEGHRNSIETRVDDAETQFDAWRQDRDTLGALGVRGTRRVAVFQGRLQGTANPNALRDGHFNLDGAVLDVGTQNNVYLYLRTHMNTATDAKMFLYDVIGYAYGEANHIAGKVAGYCYSASQSLVNLSSEGSHGLTAYEGSDGQIYLRMLFSSTYYLTLSIDAIHVGNGILPDVGSLTPIFSTEATL